MDSENEFDVNGKRITTYVTRSKEGINSVLEFVFYDSISKVVGLDIGKSSTLYLCDEFTCIIIPLLHLNSIPESLMNFLCWPEYTFVGVGIRGKMEMLETQFGIRCRNAVELGPLAADVLGMAHLRSCGVDKLALEVIGFDFGRRRLVSGLYEDSDANAFSMQQAEFATVNVCSCYHIGRKLLEKRAAISAKKGRVIRSKNWLVRFGIRKCSRSAVFVMIFLVFLVGVMNSDEFRNQNSHRRKFYYVRRMV